MGTGTNVQKRLVALHHLDAPWKPAEVEQREGRILRQGNDNEEVAIYRYVTEGSFDAYMWQALETKARFIGQVMTGDSRRPPGRGHRRPGAVLRRGQGHRLGQPGRADAGRGRRRVAAAGHPEEEPRRRAVPRPPGLPRAARDHRPADRTPGRPDGRPGDARRPCRRSAHHRRPGLPPRRCAGQSSAAASTPCPTRSRETSRYPARAAIAAWPSAWCCIPAVPPTCSWKEPRPGTPCSPATTTARVPCSTPSTGWPTATTANATPRRQDLAIAEGQLRDYEARLGQPFAHDAYLAELTALRDQLKAGLSQATPEPGTSRPVAELAERIKSLKAAHTIDAAPERTAPRRIAAEEPVTARIRRRSRSDTCHRAAGRARAGNAGGDAAGRSRRSGPP